LAPHRKGPRLWLRPRRGDRPAAWYVLDGNHQRGTGLGGRASEQEKEQALQAYLVEKHTIAATSGSRDPSQIPVADVLLHYVNNVLPDHSRPEETKQRIRALHAFFHDKDLSDVTGINCRKYAAQRSRRAAARRELEDLRAAINFHRREGLHDKIISVILPRKSLPRERWLTRDEAAALIRAAWRYREKQNHRATDRHTRRHVARFMLVARYMGSRAGVICSASIAPKRPAGRSWVDLATGLFYGRAQGERATRKRKQTVKVPLPLLAHMRRWRRRGQRHVVEWNGKPVSRIDKAHRAAVADAGLGRDVTPHVWRHSVATWLMQNGVDLWEAAGFLGMSVETLQRVYGHHHPENSAEVHAAFHAHRRQRVANDMPMIGANRS
jgi:integrase